MVKNIAAIVALSIFSGCSHELSIKPDDLNTSFASSLKSQDVVTLIDNRDEIENPEIKAGIHTYRIELRDAAFAGIYRMLSSYYAKVEIGKSPIAKNPLYIIPSYKVEVSNGAGSFSDADVKISLDIYDTQNKMRIGHHYKSLPILWRNPPSVGIATWTAATLTALRADMGTKAADDSQKTFLADCESSLENDPDLQILKGKIAFKSARDQTFEMLTNKNKPTGQERQALALYVKKSEHCASAGEQQILKQNLPTSIISIFDQIKSEKKSLLASLYTGELTYGEFAKQRQALLNTFYASLNKEVENQKRLAVEAKNKEMILALEAERNAIAQRQADAADYQSNMLFWQNIQLMNQNMIQQQAVNSMNRANSTSYSSFYRAPIQTTCRPGFGSIQCTSQ